MYSKALILLVAVLSLVCADIPADIVTGINDLTKYDKTWYSGLFDISQPGNQ